MYLNQQSENEFENVARIIANRFTLATLCLDFHIKMRDLFI